MKSSRIPKIIKYIEDMNFSRHFYSELNKLEKSPSKIGGGVSVTLFPLCDPGGGGGVGWNPNVILIRNVAFKSF